MAEKETGNLTIQEKIRLFNGKGNWQIYCANHKIPELFMSDGPHGVRKQEIKIYANINNSNKATDHRRQPPIFEKLTRTNCVRLWKGAAGSHLGSDG